MVCLNIVNQEDYFVNDQWPTQSQDMIAAQRIMEEYAKAHDTNALGLFEIIVMEQEKRMDFRLSHWVVEIATHFAQTYGPDQGDFVTRQIISRCIRQSETVH